MFLPLCKIEASYLFKLFCIHIILEAINVLIAHLYNTFLKAFKTQLLISYLVFHTVTY